MHSKLWIDAGEDVVQLIDRDSPTGCATDRARWRSMGAEELG